MKREVAIFIETNVAQLEINYSRLELFNDEKISVSSTIQNIADISKIYTDFSQGFTIPCSPTNNAIFQHFYENDVNATIDYQKRYNAYIEIDTTFFRRGKIQLEKTNIKNGKPDSYSVTFYGAGVSLKDYFNEDKLSQLDYTTLDHNYNSEEVFDRVTIDSSVTDYNVRYPLITSKRVWQFGSSVPLPDTNIPDWYNYPTNDSNNISSVTGKILFGELFPAVRVASIFKRIQAEYGITFNGLFLGSDLFRKAFLLFKNKDVLFASAPSIVTWDTTSGQPSLDPTIFNTTTNSFTKAVIQAPAGGSIVHYLTLNVTTIPAIGFGYLDMYVNGVFAVAIGIYDGSYEPITIGYAVAGAAFTFIARSTAPVIFNLSWEYIAYSAPTYTPVYIGLATSVVNCGGQINLKALAPDMKIMDFVSGICKEFNMTVYSNEKNVFTFDPLPVWYSKGGIFDITKFTDVTSIEIQRMKLYKSIEFKYQDSECMLNKYFLESPLNADGHGYGNAKVGFDYDGGEYKIESPFENLLHNNFGNNLQVGYCLNKELAPYVPKPVLLYMNEVTNLTGGDKYYFDLSGVAEASNQYIPFGQDTNILSFSSGYFPMTLNFSEEISSFYLVNNPNTLYLTYYASYLNNLYNKKNRLTKLKTILPISLLTTLELNDRLVIRDKRYLINEMQSDLTTGDVNFTLINDFEELKPIKIWVVAVDKEEKLKEPIYFSNGVTSVWVKKSGNAEDVILSSTKFEEEDFLEITIPPNRTARIITLTLLSQYANDDTDISYIIINQSNRRTESRT